MRAADSKGPLRIFRVIMVPLHVLAAYPSTKPRRRSICADSLEACPLESQHYACSLLLVRLVPFRYTEDRARAWRNGRRTGLMRLSAQGETSDVELLKFGNPYQWRSEPSRKREGVETRRAAPNAATQW